MDKLTHTAADGTVTDYFPQSYTDAAVAAAVAAVPPATGEVVKDVVVENTDGSSETMAAPDAEESAEVA